MVKPNIFVRIIAFTLDWSIAAIITFFLINLPYMYFISHLINNYFHILTLRSEMFELIFKFMFYLFLFVGFLIYYVIFNGRYSATPGKMIFSIKIITEGDENLTYKQAFKRGLLVLINLLFAGVGWLWILFNKERKSLYDIILKQKVIYDPKKFMTY